MSEAQFSAFFAAGNAKEYIVTVLLFVIGFINWLGLKELILSK